MTQLQLVNSFAEQTSGACRVCGSETTPLWVGRLLNLDVQYFECGQCSYVQTEKPHWLDRAYASPINDSDTGILARNLVNARIVMGTLWLLGAPEGKVVDYAGGYGILVRLLRDSGIEALWSDPYCENLVGRGFERKNETGTLVTAFEAFEHFVEPVEELKRMLAIAPNVLLSTMLVPFPAPEHTDWWYYGREHGQHVGLFRVQTLRTLAETQGRVLITDGSSYHLIADRNISTTLWRLVIRANRLFPFLLRNRLSSKTWSDHLAIAGRVGKSS